VSRLPPFPDRYRRTAVVAVVCAALSGAFLPAASAQAGGAQPASPKPVAGVNNAVSSEVRDVVVTNGARYEFGTVSVLDTPVIEHVFRLKNTTDTPIGIGRLVASCGCTSAVIDAGVIATAPSGQVSPPPLATLAPGQEAGVRVAINTEKLAPGRIHKTVTVFFASGLTPVVQLEIDGILKPTVSLTPAFTNLGEVSVGTSHSVRVNVLVDARVAAAGSIPDLAITDDQPAFRITRLPAEANAAASATQPPALGTVTRTYLITLAPDAPLGLVSGRIGFVLPGMGAPGIGSRPPLTGVERSYRNVAATIVAKVVGDVTAQPTMAAFGYSKSKEPATRTVTLTGKTASSLTGLTLETVKVDRCLTVRLLAPTEGQMQTRTIEITCDPSGAEPGTHFARIRVTLANGHHIDIPISAYIPPGG
jgi:hypothetical protein